MLKSGYLPLEDTGKASCCTCAGRERVHRWWHTKQLADNRVIMGKPSVLHRKVVNTRVGDEIIAVNAQQYAVLVMDVPNLHKENRKCASPPSLDPHEDVMTAMAYIERLEQHSLPAEQMTSPRWSEEVWQKTCTS